MNLSSENWFVPIVDTFLFYIEKKMKTQMNQIKMFIHVLPEMNHFSWIWNLFWKFLILLLFVIFKLQIPHLLRHINDVTSRERLQWSVQKILNPNHPQVTWASEHLWDQWGLLIYSHLLKEYYIGQKKKEEKSKKRKE